METALAYLVFHETFMLLAQVVENLAQEDTQAIGGNEASRVGHVVAVVGNVERGAVAVSRVFAGVGIAAAQRPYRLVGAQCAGENDLPSPGSAAGQRVVEILADGHEQPFGFWGEVGYGVGEFVDGIIFATVDFGEFPKSQSTGFVERLERLDAVFAGAGEVAVVEVVEEFSETGVPYGALSPADRAGLGLLFHFEGVDERTFGVVGFDLLAFAAGDGSTRKDCFTKISGYEEGCEKYKTGESL